MVSTAFDPQSNNHIDETATLIMLNREQYHRFLTYPQQNRVKHDIFETANDIINIYSYNRRENNVQAYTKHT